MSSNKIDMDISTIVTPDLISLDLKSRTKLGVIEELTDLLYKHQDVSDKQAFIRDVLFRETEGLTGIGQGVAIPHGKSPAVSHTTIAIGLSKFPIEWESLDSEPVTAVILFAVRDRDSNTLHLKLLQKVAMLLADDGFIDRLHKVSSKEELIELLK
ncbi:PTS sugar transporter subunit IIA [Streptococcus tangpeifui]|uniref:PTS system, fructose-specific, IIA component family protein n=1 Tax=Streptococcus criceti HS-6 TaxID=873449 RepID=G5JQ62_STRCG|nr:MULTISPECIES: PTS sugar transporter subunit IIA [Streptococcus]EHI73598.1 PTS system, fructose-specific, IIA component family protein [Streptococcus criceti HS-6]SUN43149.1 PTS system transporter subunit IIA [Streptococcus criceti]